MGEKFEKLQYNPLLQLSTKEYQKKLEESIRGSQFTFDSVNSFCFKLHKISLNRGGSYIDSPKWLNNKKATITLKNNDEK